jgi:hypothetical protein
MYKTIAGSLIYTVPHPKASSNPSLLYHLESILHPHFSNMRFSMTSAVALMAGLTASGSAFVMDTFSDDNCGNSVQRDVNTWDNTCATWPDGFKSFKITTWGGTHQHAYFFAPDNCGSLPGAVANGYVDSSTNDYKLGGCYNFRGSVANAVASYYG